MIVINEGRFGGYDAFDAFATWHWERVRACPGHVWHRGPMVPAWVCVHCPAWGKIR